MRPWFQSSARILIAVLAVAALCFVSSVSIGVRLLAKTVLALGGNGNATGLLMENELAGYIKPGDPNYGLCDTTGGCDDDIFTPGSWNATVWTLGSDFDHQQADGVQSLDTQLRAALAAEQEKSDSGVDPEVHVVVVGYSSSADVVIKEMLALQQQNEIDPGEVSFLVMGNPNRPNGGILARFPAFTVPIAGVTVGGSNPDTDFQLTDVSWEYDLASDAPAYLNPLSFANAVVGFFYQHSFYYGADPNGPGVIYDETAPGTNDRYITIAAKHLAMLQPFYDFGIPVRLLDSVEPTLRVLIDLGYDRETPPWEPTQLQLAPPPEQLAAAVPDLQAAISEGVQIALGQKPPPSEGDEDSENATLAVIDNVLGGLLKEIDWDTVRETIENALNPNMSAPGTQVVELGTQGTGPTDMPASVTADLTSLTPQPKTSTTRLPAFEGSVAKRGLDVEKPARQELSTSVDWVRDAVDEAGVKIGDIPGKPRDAADDRLTSAIGRISDKVKADRLKAEKVRAELSRDLRGLAKLKPNSKQSKTESATAS